jgi:hypothetical protein
MELGRHKGIKDAAEQRSNRTIKEWNQSFDNHSIHYDGQLANRCWICFAPFQIRLLVDAISSPRAIAPVVENRTAIHMIFTSPVNIEK